MIVSCITLIFVCYKRTLYVISGWFSDWMGTWKILLVIFKIPLYQFHLKLGFAVICSCIDVSCHRAPLDSLQHNFVVERLESRQQHRTGRNGKSLSKRSSSKLPPASATSKSRKSQSRGSIKWVNFSFATSHPYECPLSEKSKKNKTIRTLLSYNTLKQHSRTSLLAHIIL